MQAHCNLIWNVCVLIIHSGKRYADKPLVFAHRCHSIIIIIIDLLSTVIIIMIIINSEVSEVFQGIRVTDETLLIHCSGKSFPTTRHVLRLLLSA